MVGELEVKGVKKEFIGNDGETVTALNNFELTIESGSFVSLIVPSGCGKSTLLRLIGGLDKANEGTILLDGKAITKPGSDRGFAFQGSNLFPWLTVEQNIAYGLRARGVFKKDKSRVKDYIGMVGLDGFEKSYPHQISGGMAQRVAIARALINDPKALLLDEPMGALDSFTRADLQDKILELWKQQGTTMILVTHDIDEAIYLSDRIVIMTPRPGKISSIVNVDLPRPRHRGGTEFLALRKSILEFFELAQAQPQPEYII